jgi:coproporphyrinogen III oxidase
MSQLDSKTEVQVDSKTIEEEFKAIQEKICEFLIQTTGQHYQEDIWDYEKGTGGGRSRIWEGGTQDVLEKAGVNWSGIYGPEMPESATAQLKIPPKTPFHATGVSLVIHPKNPHIPTIHMNVRYFSCGNVWWFGGGIDLTPYYTSISQVVEFHRSLKKICDDFGQSYETFKATCDQYFTLPHRKEMRGVGGLFFDHLTTGESKKPTKEDLFQFVVTLGKSFNEIYAPFLVRSLQTKEYTAEQREFQLIRRGRYVEFNLMYDRGTKFGLQSGGRIESILMSLPAEAHWKYNWTPNVGSPEHIITTFYYQPQEWVTLKVDESHMMNQYAPQKVKKEIQHRNTFLLGAVVLIGASLLMAKKLISSK